ncbi:MAG: cold-shock protein [Anaerolineae bacterium]
MRQEDETEVFLHASSFRDNRTMHPLPGQVVSYQVEQTGKGLLATDVDSVK